MSKKAKVDPAPKAPAKPPAPATKPDQAKAIVPAAAAPKAIDEIFTWILEGFTEAQLLAVIDKKWPGTKPMPLIVAAMKRIAASAEADPATVRGWCIEATRHVYMNALAVGDLAVALRAIKQLADFAW